MPYDHRQGNTGILDTASKGTLEDEFGTHKDEDVVTQILEKGSVIESEVGIYLVSPPMLLPKGLPDLAVFWS